MKNNLMIDVGDIDKIKSAKDAVAISMFDALLYKEHKDPRRREMREGQLEGLKVIADLLNQIVTVDKKMQDAINFKADIESD
jgi:hypothetical protein